MTEFIVCALAAAFILSAIEELILSLGKFKGLIGLLSSGASAYAQGITSWGHLVPTALAATFVALTAVAVASTAVQAEVARTARALPRRVPPL